MYKWETTCLYEKKMCLSTTLRQLNALHTWKNLTEKDNVLSKAQNALKYVIAYK